MNRKMVLIILGVVLCAGLARGAAPTFQALMDPAVFPDAQRGMVVEQATLDAGILRIVTTGAEMTANAMTARTDSSVSVGKSSRIS